MFTKVLASKILLRKVAANRGIRGYRGAYF